MAEVKVGVIRNPRSQRNRVARDPGPEPEVLSGRLRLDVPMTPEALAETLREYRDAGIDHVVVDGGDGTLREVLTLLPAIYGDRLPTISLIASGNTNLATADVGGFTRGPQALAQVLATVEGRAPSRQSERTVIEAIWPDGSRPPVSGFFLGSAGYLRGWRMAHADIHRRGLWHRWGVAATVAGAAWQVITGRPDSDWQRGSPLSLAVDDGEPRDGARFVFLATSLDTLFMGLWPFWNQDGDASRPLRWLDIDAPPPGFARGLRGLLRGQPSSAMRASGAYRSGQARRLRLRLQEELVIDGEAYAPDRDGLIELRPGARFRFHAPA